MQFEAGRDHLPASGKDLLAQTQTLDDGAIPVDILLLQIVQQIAAMTDHLEHTAAGVIVLLVHPQMLSQVADALGQYGDLNLRRTGVSLVDGVLLHNGGLFLGQHHNALHLFLKNVDMLKAQLEALKAN